MNKDLNRAKKQKNDEFYTQLRDIENELKHYKQHFKGKVVYCNCDDPRVSNFFVYFSLNFEFLGLKKLIATCYKNEDSFSTTKRESDRAVYLEYTGDKNGNFRPDDEEIEVYPLEGDGDFRSEECIELLKQADIVVTNPPFSLFREYVAQLVEYEKKFLILGNLNAITYKEIFPLIKDNKLWLGINNGAKKFEVPENYDLKETEEIEGKKYCSMGNVIWYTNLTHKRRNEKLRLYKSYTPEEFPTYDNYDAINVDKVSHIPEEYEAIMGVPITFLDNYNPKQFEILGLNSGRYEFECQPTKRYINAIQHNKDGTTTSGSKANTRSAVLFKNKPEGTYYTADNVDGFLKLIYARVFIRRKA